jgi:hypothetical protein
MLSFAIRSFVGLTIWVCAISPTGAQWPGREYAVAGDAIYRFGTQMFSDESDDSPSELLPVVPDPDGAPLQAPEAAMTDGLGAIEIDFDLLSDELE